MQFICFQWNKFCVELSLMRFLAQSLVVCDIGLNGRTEQSVHYQSHHLLCATITLRYHLFLVDVSCLFIGCTCILPHQWVLHPHLCPYTTGNTPAIVCVPCALSGSPSHFASLQLLSLYYHFCPPNCYEMSLSFRVCLMYVSTGFSSGSVSLFLDQQIYMWYRNIIFVYIFLYNCLDFGFSFCFLSFLIFHSVLLFIVNEVNTMNDCTAQHWCTTMNSKLI